MSPSWCENLDLRSSKEDKSKLHISCSFNTWKYEIESKMKYQQTEVFHNNKVHIFWEGHKILRNLHLTFVLCSASQK